MNPRLPTSAIAASAVVLLSLGLVGCGTDDSGDTASTSSPATTSSSSSSAASSGDVAALAEAFAATLADDQLEALNQDYTFANASNWSNFPNALLTGGSGGFGGGGSGAPGGALPSGALPSGGAPGGGGAGSTSSTGRVGLQTDSLTDAQWTALEDLLRAVTGSAANEGFDEIMQHLSADDYLADNGGGDDYGRGNYFIAFLGEPSDSGTWELQFGGHHLAVANTYVDGVLGGATPSFRGIEPLTTVTEDGVTVQPEQQEQAAFQALLASLSSDQLATAQLSQTFGDILLGPGNDWAFPTTSEGVAGSELTDDQKALLLAAIDTYVDDVDDADAATILAGYESELDDTYVSFSGNSSVSEVGDYVRIDGPSVWIEFSLQNGIVLQGAHPHAVWRDKKTDYAGLTS
ncbi:DUF3500 domain-containing protein [Klenkia soli]|uniref:DUF3500 domain-containing protein n=1 Tax=Klenkia soli TaxID=1052260 RepID=UPI001A9691AE|nr:DUF3500 domain-containing protein [Klenkia soli]